MKHVVVNQGLAPTVLAMINLFNTELESYALESEKLTSTDNIRPRALIIDGPSLILAMKDLKVKAALLEFSIKCSSVVACRVSPDQKRAMVR
jgi:magnesium-transporting ATPase (P-type)